MSSSTEKRWGEKAHNEGAYLEKTKEDGWSITNDFWAKAVKA